jgi:sulfonate transport system ATP-binding protein
VAIGGVPVTALQHTVRLLFQDARLLPWQTAIGNVGIARAPGWRDSARAALADVGLAGRENDWPATLSGGERQRVALARALISNPRVLLLDEPFGALDALTRAEMHQLTERIWTERRFTTVPIIHDVAEAVSLSDRVLVLRDGRIALDLPVTLPRPRGGHVDPAPAELQSRILKEV